MRLMPTAKRLMDAKRSIVGRERHPLHADQPLGRAEQYMRPTGKVVVVHVPGDFHHDETAQSREHASDGEDGEGAEQRGRLGLRAEEVALDDQEDEDSGTHEQRHHVGRVHEVQRERPGQQSELPQSRNAVGPFRMLRDSMIIPIPAMATRPPGRLYHGNREVLHDQVQVRATAE